jgi:GntR family transcriptional regulator/MocR family aminotransferase
MKGRIDRAMWGRLFGLSAGTGRPLQAQIREMMVSAILEEHLPPGGPVPSSRELSEHLGVARNTVVLAYQQLVDEGFLVSRERSGYYVSPDIVAGRVTSALPLAPRGGPDWSRRLGFRPSAQRNISKPQDWQRYPHPFLYGQFDPTLFPIADWRECCRQALSVLEVRGWAPDLIDGDDAQLVEQLRTRVLPRRGAWAAPDEIMVTIGAQQALFLLAELFAAQGAVFGIEDPGYPDARNIFSLKNRSVRALAVDAEGVVPDEALRSCDYVYLTPSHQCPTTVTMPLARRNELLALAEAQDMVLIEDDYESETNFADAPTPALKSLDRSQRVIYVGSLSKTLAPGLRLGYIVGPAELIREARALRRLMLRHPPANNQRAAALFLSLGHYDALIRRLTHVLKDRAEAASSALARHLPDFVHTRNSGGSSYWITGPETLDGRALAEAAKARGILIEPGDVFFVADNPPRNHFRLGFSSIPVDRIEPGIAELAKLARPAKAA